MITKKKLSPFWVEIGLGLLLFTTLWFGKVLLASFPISWLASLIQMLGLLVLFYWLNKKYLGVKVTLYNTHQSFLSQLLALMPLWFYMLWANIPLLLEMKSENILFALRVGLQAGIMEEFICRGILLGYLMMFSEGKVNKIWSSLFLSSLIFGLAHATNVFYQPLEYTIFQIIMATLGGAFDGAIYLRTKSLIWVIFSHFLQDFASLAAEGEGLVAQAVPWSILPVAFLVYSGLIYILLSPKKIQTVLDHQWSEIK